MVSYAEGIVLTDSSRLVLLIGLELSLQLAIMKLEKAVRMFNPAGASLAAPSGGASMGTGTPEAASAGMGAPQGMGM